MLREVAGVPAFDRVRREREGRAGKTDERYLASEFLLDLADGGQHVRQRLARLDGAQGVDVGGRSNRVLDRRPLAVDEIEADAHRLERQQQIGKQNGGVDFDGRRAAS